MPRHLESHIQRACTKYFRYQYPGMARLLFAIPNGGKRGEIEARILSAEGVVAGVSDMIFLKPSAQYSALCIEFKTETGKQTELQKSWQDLVEKHGNKYVICHNLDEFIKEITEYIHPNQK